jgi:SAM-dependent methyltransferase
MIAGRTIAGRVRYGGVVLSRTAHVLAALVRNRVGGLPPRRSAASWNTLFDREAVAGLEHERSRLQTFDLTLWSTLNDSRLYGQIVFEYGTLLNAVSDWRGLKVLDIGTGRSTLPNWMTAQGARVVSFELPERHEKKPLGWLDRMNVWIRGVRTVTELHGSMRAIPVADNTFDVVTSLSVVEHLDTDLPSRAYVPYPEQQRRLREVLDEMIRVTRPGGLVYITSECCDYTRATEDEWRPAYYYLDGPALSGAWPAADVPALFYDYFKAHGCTIEGAVAYDARHVDANGRHRSFRGPYFSGFCLTARKRT